MSSNEPLNSEDPRQEPAALAPPMAGVVRHAMGLFAALNLVSKFGAFAANIILAWLLAPHDFGVYGAAIAVAAVAGIFRDGGVRELLIERGAQEYSRILGTVSWYALFVSGLAAAVLAALSPWLANAYQMPDLVGPLVVIAIALPLGVPGSLYRCKLRIDLRFGALGNMGLIGNAIRYSGTILFAWGGAGAMSFVLPLLLVAIYEWAAGFYYTRDHLFRDRIVFSQWPAVFQQTKWLIVGALAFMMVEQGDYLVAGLFVDETTLGYFFFAAQLLFQTAYSLLSYTVQLVLFPALVKLRDETERRIQASWRFLGSLMIVVSPMCFGLAVIAQPLFDLILEPKWQPSVLPLQVLAFLYPLRCTIGLTTSMLMAEGRFKRNALYMIGEGSLLLAVTAFVAFTWKTPVAVAAGVGASLATSRLIILALTFRAVGGSALPALGRALYPWTLAAACAAATLYCAAAFSGEWPSFVALVFNGALFSALYAALLRIVSAKLLHEALVIAPARLQPLLTRILVLRPRQEDQ